MADCPTPLNYCPFITVEHAHKKREEEKNEQEKKWGGGGGIH